MTRADRNTLIQFLKLIKRSPDPGNGWRSVSDPFVPIAEDFANKYPELVVMNDQKIYMTREARTLLEWEPTA